MLRNGPIHHLTGPTAPSGVTPVVLRDGCGVQNTPWGRLRLEVARAVAREPPDAGSLTWTARAAPA
jgi:hypothetical protein